MENQIKEWKDQTIKERRSTVEDLLKRNKDKLMLALPKHLTPEKLIGTVLTSIARNPKLLDCTQSSLLGSVWTAAQLGLNPNGLLGEGYLNPYKNKKASTIECQFIPGYRGYMKLAYQSGKVKTYQAECVYENDSFEYEKGLNAKLIHKPSKPPRGKLIAVYVIVHLINGGVLFDVMYQEEVEIIRLAAPGKDSPAWKNHYDEMAKKTVCRRIAKITPVSTEIELAAGLDEKAEVLDESQRTDLALLDVDISPEINEEINNTITEDAEVISEEENKSNIDETKTKANAAIESAINQAKKNGNGNNKNSEYQRLLDGVSYYKAQVKEAKEKNNPKLAADMQSRYEDAVNRLNDYLKSKKGENK